MCLLGMAALFSRVRFVSHLREVQDLAASKNFLNIIINGFDPCFLMGFDEEDYNCCGLTLMEIGVAIIF